MSLDDKPWTETSSPMTRREIEDARAHLKAWFPNQSVERHTFNKLCDQAVRAVSAPPEALPIPTSERLPEYQQNVLLWLVTKNQANSGWVLGQRSSHEEGKFWDGERYRPMEWITHWKPLPDAPSIPSPLAEKT